MKGSFKLFRIKGISIEIHITFLLLPLLFGFTSGLKGVFIIFAIFSCVAAHELSHSFVAKSYGINVDRITLLPIGGIASMRSLPETPGQEFAISLAGPLFNVVLTILLYFPLKLILGPYVLFHPNPDTWPGALAYAYWVNPVLAGFNLLPAFPMDGGRIFRSLLAKRISYIKATKIAVGFGHLFALIFAFVALTSHPPNFILLLIAFFIFMAASQEETAAGLKTALGKLKVADIISDRHYTVSPQATLRDVVNLVLHSRQEDFPVLTEEGKVVGFLPRDKIASALHSREVDKKVEDVMLHNFPVLKENELLSSAYSKMENSDLKALPVLEENVLKGIVTLEDVSKAYSLFSKRKL